MISMVWSDDTINGPSEDDAETEAVGVGVDETLGSGDGPRDGWATGAAITWLAMTTTARRPTRIDATDSGEAIGDRRLNLISGA
jgi:hypothetical protein